MKDQKPLELLPCPFCGAKGKIEPRGLDGWRGRCSKGCCTTGDSTMTERQVIKSWNTRALPSKGTDDIDVYILNRRGNAYGLFLTYEFAEKVSKLKQDEDPNVNYKGVKGIIHKIKLSEALRMIEPMVEKEEVVKRCPDCRGTGNLKHSTNPALIGSILCWRCHGSGSVPKEASANKEFSGYQTEGTPGLEWDAAKEVSIAKDQEILKYHQNHEIHEGNCVTCYNQTKGL